MPWLRARIDTGGRPNPVTAMARQAPIVAVIASRGANNHMAILMGLISALCWGSTDFMAGQAARRVGVTRSLFYSQSIGLLLLSVVLAFHPAWLRIGALDAGLLVAIVTVLSSLASAVTVLLGFVIRHERPSAAQWLGIAAILVGVVLLKVTPAVFA
ncbi:EamA-like transporter family protein [Burkholderia sp. SJZ089]|nr:EamA-like transporter family protein [Burkholderia sp. SJZ089]